MFAVQGYFEEGHFFPDFPVAIPDRKKTIITILDETIDAVPKIQRQSWAGIIEELRNCDEKLEGEPERITFKTPEQIDKL